MNDVNSHLEQLRLSSVEREFRKRIAEYKRSEGESGSVSYHYLLVIEISALQKNLFFRTETGNWSGAW